MRYKKLLDSGEEMNFWPSVTDLFLSLFLIVTLIVVIFTVYSYEFRKLFSLRYNRSLIEKSFKKEFPDEMKDKYITFRHFADWTLIGIEEALLFESGKYEINSFGQSNLKKLGKVLCENNKHFHIIAIEVQMFFSTR